MVVHSMYCILYAYILYFDYNRFSYIQPENTYNRINGGIYMFLCENNNTRYKKYLLLHVCNKHFLYTIPHEKLLHFA
jgi:hypothetical protein